MSSAWRRPAHPAPAALLALFLVAGACAASPAGDEAAEQAEADTAGSDTGPALSQAELRDAADRAPPLERANFWAGEHARNPEDLDTALHFIAALRGIGSHERAAEVASQAAVIHPESDALYVALGRALAAQGQHQTARKAFEQASRLNPQNADAFAAKGLSLDRLGEHDAAQAAYRQALQLQPDRASTRSNLGLSLALTGELEAAEHELRKAIALPDANTRVRQNLALVLGLQGDYDGMREVSADAPQSIVEQNANLLKALRGKVDPASLQ